MKDGKRVAIKNVAAGSQEVSLARSLSADELTDDDNCCVHILDYFDDREEAGSGRGFLVMPLLVPFHKPDFIYVEEVIEFIRQTVHVSTSLFILHQLTNLSFCRVLYTCTEKM